MLRIIAIIAFSLTILVSSAGARSRPDEPLFPDGVPTVSASATPEEGIRCATPEPLVAVGFTAFGFLLHLRGASGSASVMTACGLLGAGLWLGFFSAELYGYRYLLNLYGIDPSLATALFSTVWFWKMGAMAAAALLTFTAVTAGGLTGTARGILPVWLGWGGALFAIAGMAIYVFAFLGSTATGAAINPMQSMGVRLAVGLPLQLWVLGVGVLLLRAYVTREPIRPE